MKERNYEVEVLSKYQNGRYGCARYFGMVLWTSSIKSAESFAYEVIREMTKKEFNAMCGNSAFVFDDTDELILDEADRFKFKARRAI